MLHTIESEYNDISGKIIVDLGCGTGMLSLGAFLLGCERVVGFEIDAAALSLARANADIFEATEPELLFAEADVTRIHWEEASQSLVLLPLEKESESESEDESEDESNSDDESRNAKDDTLPQGSSQAKILASFDRDIDVVIMNPPFGTKVKGADLLFVEKACQVPLLSCVFSK